MKSIQLSTSKRTQFLEISNQVQAYVDETGLIDGAVMVFVPHTTAGVTVNEHADPHVMVDLDLVLDEVVPWTRRSYQHVEGNTAAHAKASLMGSSALVPVQGGRLVLGTWQGVFFCEFDGPRTRTCHMQVLSGA